MCSCVSFVRQQVLEPGPLGRYHDLCRALAWLRVLLFANLSPLVSYSFALAMDTGALRLPNWGYPDLAGIVSKQNIEYVVHDRPWRLKQQLHKA